MVKSVATIYGIDAMSFGTEQLCVICAKLKLTGYCSKPKAELLRIIGVGCMHQSMYGTNLPVGTTTELEKVPAKTRNCSFWLINVLFSDEMSPKFEKVGEWKDKELIDSGLLSNDEFFWQEVSERYQESCEDFDQLAFEHPMFANVDPSIRLEHNWMKLCEIFKGLMKGYSEVYDNHKKSGNHDDFENFVGNCSELLYLYFWLQEKPQLQPMVIINLPEEVFFDTSVPDQIAARPLRRSPTGSESSLKFSGKSTLAASVTAFIEERRKSRELSLVQSDPYVSQLTKEKLEMQVSHNLEDNVNRLIEVKWKLEVETNPGIVKVLKKYEKRLKEVIDMTSSSENEEE